MNVAPSLALLAIEAHPLAHVDAALNALATLLLVAGYVLIKRRREVAHQRVMLAAFGVSVLFLVCYLAHHWAVGGSVHFRGTGAVRLVYYPLLVTHVILAATVPFLAVATIWLGYQDRRPAHRRLARWTFPIWLYVSITGVLVYFMLYYWFPG